MTTGMNLWDANVWSFVITMTLLFGSMIIANTLRNTIPALRRLMERDRISAQYARSRIDAQPADDWFRDKCGYVLENNGSQAEFQTKCLAFLRELGIMKT